MRIEQVEPGAVARLASDKLAAFGHLLNEQVGALSRDLTMAEQRVRQEFNLGFYGAVTAISLQRDLQGKQAELRSYIAALTQDLQRIEDDKALKEWLKEQNALAKQNERNELMGAFGHAF
jgi:hypothetical protein